MVGDDKWNDYVLIENLMPEGSMDELCLGSTNRRQCWPHAQKPCSLEPNRPRFLFLVCLSLVEASCFSSLSLNFLICKVGLVTVLAPHGYYENYKGKHMRSA